MALLGYATVTHYMYCLEDLWMKLRFPQTGSGQMYVQFSKQESRAVARKPREAAAVHFGLKFADNIH